MKVIIDNIREYPLLIAGIILFISLGFVGLDFHWILRTGHSIAEGMVALFFFYVMRRVYLDKGLEELDEKERRKRENVNVLGMAIIIACALL